MPDCRLKIISGGQTGIDRGALDAALALGAPCGGWCPEGRLDENGRIPEHYPLAELPGGGFDERTIRNVQDSDGTLVLCFGELGGGTKLTVEACRRCGRPNLVVDALQLTTEECSARVEEFVRAAGIHVLNVAGPRATEEPDAYPFAFEVITALLRRLGAVKSV